MSYTWEKARIVIQHLEYKILNMINLKSRDWLGHGQYRNQNINKLRFSLEFSPSQIIPTQLSPNAYFSKDLKNRNIQKARN